MRDEELPRVEEVLARYGDVVPSPANAAAARIQQGAGLPDVVRALDAAGISIANLTLHAPTLDDVFLNKTGRSLEGEGEGAEAEAAIEAPEEVEEPPAAPGVELEIAAAGRSKIQKVPTSILKDWMADRQLKEAKAATKTPTLKITAGPLAGQDLQVENSVVIGREGDLVIQDPEISRRHATIRVVDGTLVIDDLQSLNGTWVNERRIELPTLLAPGDIINLGNTTIAVQA
jgi:hypothetical protein